MHRSCPRLLVIQRQLCRQRGTSGSGLPAVVLSVGVGVGLELSRSASTDALPSTPSLGISLDIASARAAKDVVRPCLLKHEFDYDVIVVGGGSGGLAAAREVAAAGGRVMLLDHVEPSPHGTKWGLGGTCVNVGCIPKKLMHQAALLGQGLHDAAEYGWRLDAGTVTHDWGVLMESVRNYIRGTNWGYRNALRDERVQYVNARGRLGPDGHTVQWAGKQAGSATAAHVIVAVGGRPRYPEGVEGASEHGITSDDLFWLPESPGKTLLVGGGYVALECAGALTHIGLPATVMIRGPSLRGFDQQMAEKIVKSMADTGTRFLRAAEPFKVEPSPVPGPAGERRLRVHFRITRPAHDRDRDGGSGHGADAAAAPRAVVTEASHEDFDTVVFATGRAPVQVEGAREAGLALSRGGKVVSLSTARAPMTAALTGQTSSPTASEALEGRDVGVSMWSETSSAPSVHAVGDVLAGRPELTPVAIQAGRLLARRIVAGLLPVHTGGSDPDAVAATIDEGARVAAADAARVRRLTMDYALVPTTVFTPLEYGCIGLAEEEAVATHGAAGIEVFHLQYDTLELSLAHRADETGMPLPPQCYAKLITTHGGGDPEQQRVIGLHVLGPSAGEVVQGFAVALRMGATKADFDATVGIHPTHAEEVVGLDTTKRSGESFVKTSC